MADGLRRIVHVDMDAFYASVEQRDQPALRGKPVAVGGTQRGVVAAASYEARRFGVRSAMPMSRALRLCPGLVVVPPDFPRYRAVSEQVFALFRAVTPLVEPLSIDEAFLDVTENAWGEPLAMEVARRLKAQIKEQVGLTASAGVGPNKLIAKIASGHRKPDGLTVVAPARVEAFLRDLPVDVLWGVGPVTAARLGELGFRRVADLLAVDLAGESGARLQEALGSYAPTLLALARGIDERPVEPHWERKSVGAENTFAEDLTELEVIQSEVGAMASDLAGWLLDHARAARTVTLKVRYDDFTTITRSETRRPATRDPDELSARAIALLARTEVGTRPVRLLGVSLHGLTDEGEEESPSGAGVQLLLPFPRSARGPLPPGTPANHGDH